MPDLAPHLSALVAQLQSLSPHERGAALTQMAGGLDAHLGLRFSWAAADRVVAHIDVLAHHTQPYGLVHGGVYCTLVEAVGSTGAALQFLPEGRMPVGVGNHTRFLRASRTGAKLTAEGVPESVTARGATWRVRITTDDGVLRAEGTLEARALGPNASVDGAPINLLGTAQ